MSSRKQIQKKKNSLPDYWPQACKELSKTDPLMKELIRRYPGDLRSRGNAFETLFRSIVGQQISVKAAQSVWDRVCTKVDVRDPESIFECDKLVLRQCGLSERKVEYSKDLANHFIQKKVNPHRWRNKTDEEIIEELIDIKGIGRWTAEMFLIFHLLRPNVFPKADLGLQKALSLVYKKKYPLSDRQLKIFEKKFSPWGSVATWYLWRSLDPIPVEY